jgi:regulation of enolase protein 1 (concanavalin A-like superfamily)
MTACSPQREGFEARFADFMVGPPIARQLHADLLQQT